MTYHLIHTRRSVTHMLIGVFYFQLTLLAFGKLLCGGSRGPSDTVKSAPANT